MFKKILLIAAMIFPMLAAAQSVKIGIVDTNAIIAALPETKTAQTQIDEQSKKLDAEYQNLGTEMQRLYSELENMKDDTPQTIKERKAREFQDYQKKMAQFEQTAMQDLQKMQAELMQPILAKVQNAIESVGKEGSFTLIQDKNPQIVLYYAAPAIDITNDVKTKLGI